MNLKRPIIKVCITLAVGIIAYVVLKCVENSSNEYLLLPYFLFMIIGFSFALCIGLSMPIVLFGLPAIIAKKQYKKYKVDEEKLSKNKNYYREILKTYLPCELSYVDNYELDEFSVVATLLDLQRQNKIKIDNHKIKVCDNKDESNDVELYVINQINNGKLRIDLREFKAVALKSCLYKQLLKRERPPRTKLFTSIIIALVIKVALDYLFPVLINYAQSINIISSGGISFILTKFAVMIPSIYIIMAIAKYVFMHKEYMLNPYKRTELGKDINLKLEGLKNFLRDFSSLDELDKEHLALWNEYLIYSVMFGDNKVIMNEYKDLIEYRSYY